MTIDHHQPDFGRLDAITFDVDGVLTDGGITYLDDGRELKTFNVQDGTAFKMMMQAGIAVGWITGRSSPIVQRRANELGIHHLYQGIQNKSDAFADFLAKVSVPADKAAHVGDDLPDLALFSECTIGISVPNGHPVVRAGAAFVTATRGGDGVARELCELILRAKGLWHYP